MIRRGLSFLDMKEPEIFRVTCMQTKQHDSTGLGFLYEFIHKFIASDNCLEDHY